MERVNVDPVSGQVDIDGVALPFKVTPDFTTPYFDKALHYWEHYQFYAQRIGKKPYTPAEYLDALCIALGCAGIRERSATRWKERVLEHFGTVRMGHFFTQRATTMQNDIFPVTP